MARTTISQKLAAGRQLSATLGKAVLAGVDVAITKRWTAALSRAREVEGDSVDAKVNSLARSFAKELASVGAATGAAAALPAVGTTAAISAGIAEFSWFTIRASELVLTIGALHGH